MYRRLFFLPLLAVLYASLHAQNSNPACTSSVTHYVNPFLGTATLWEPEDLGYTHTEAKRAWGGETYPGATLPNAMVQATPVTMYHSGSGYQYEDHEIYAFAHTAKGHWDQLHFPILPVTGIFYPQLCLTLLPSERRGSSGILQCVA